jgi:tRNA (guanine-N7-)-methyltransferase
VAKKSGSETELSKKLARFNDVANFSNCVQVPAPHVLENFPLRGQWANAHFGNSNPITLELACGKGEYSLGQGRLFAERNFIGVDIKGNRLWCGAKAALDEGLTNVAYLRTHIDHIDRIFGPDEIDSIWVVFADPQPGKARKRLTSPMFIDRYRRVLKPGGTLHLKTDSELLYTYTLEVIEDFGLKLVCRADDLYADLASGTHPHLNKMADVLRIKTYYEGLWEREGRTIRYLACTL